MTTVERALRVLIHDIRTPVGVAQGYLRLLQQGRLASGELRERAFQQALRAMEQLARLADHAEFLVEETPEAPRVAISSQLLVDRVCVRLSASAVAVVESVAPHGLVRTTPDVDRLSDAIAGVLLSAGEQTPATPGSVIIGASKGELWFTTDPAPDGGLDGEPLDPWRSPGLAVPAACRAVDQAGGRLWSSRRDARSVDVGVAFPLEVSR